MILITGATGFIGSHLVKELVRDYKLRCIIRKSQEPTQNIEFIYGDISKMDSLEKAFQKVDTVIHVAALTQGSSQEIIKANVEGTRNLVLLSKKYKIKRFILISSNNVLLKHKGPYASSKLQSENIVMTSGLDYIILRPNWVYDHKGNRDLKNIISLVKKTPLVPIIGNGRYKFQPVYVKDLVSVIKKTLENKILKNKIYAVNGSESLSFDELIDEISKDLNLRRRKIHIPLALLRLIPSRIISQDRITEIIQDKVGDNKEAIKDFNFQPISIKESLRKMLK
ncbi:hypothetical protein CMI37_24410 [Candidatus Pacearchaeota archaeon]|nr:hypothetical protein [Candidatus Pacearchaeota archaeon]|tara:strand:- start:702 stop:1547 length:846 start_codon:yes stop_codon:yes gene_type:complete